jgi:nitrogen-specific signal transduction histidine kinase
MEALQRSEEQLRQAQKMEAIGRLAGGVAHDFNNLLTIIKGNSELLLNRRDVQEPLRRYVEQIKQGGDRAAELTRQLLAFSRQQVLQAKVLDLNAIVASMRSMLERLLGEDIDLAANLDPNLGHVKADPGQLGQVIMNLVVNTRDAMPQGGKVTIETSNVEIEAPRRHDQIVRPGRYVMLSVSDNGCGMDRETQARIFEPFFTTKEQGKGTGLGLSTVYGIVKQSDGYIFVYSEVGAGTTFKIYLPRVETVAEQTGGEEAAPERLHATETVLLVEDEPGVRRVAREALIACGFTVLEARHGIEALLVAKQHPSPIHLLVTDVVMPQMNGPEVASRLASSRPAMKVLYMSGYTDHAVVHHGVIDPGFAFLQKPFSPEDLVQKVREVLRAAPIR